MFLESNDRSEYFFNDYIIEDFHITNFGHEKCLPNHSFGPYVRDYYVLHYVLKGKGTFSFNNNSFQLKHGDFFLITPFDIAPVYQADANDPWEYIWFGFNGEKVDIILKELGYYTDNKVGHLIDFSTFENQVCELLKSDFFLKSSTLTVQGKLLELLSLLNFDSTTIALNSNIPSSERHIFQFVTYIRQNFWQTDLSVQKIANDLNLNISYLSRLVSQHFDQSTLSYLTNYRLLKGKFLIETTNHTIETISKAVGYENPLSFSRAYKRVYGHSPRNIKKVPTHDSYPKNN